MLTPRPTWENGATQPGVRIVFPHCASGPCKNGRAICPTPQACAIAADEPPRRPRVPRIRQAVGFAWWYAVGIVGVLCLLLVLAVVSIIDGKAVEP
jgi:hypothetical protein